MEEDSHSEPGDVSIGSSSTSSTSSTDQRLEILRLLNHSITATTTTNDFENPWHEPREYTQENLLEISATNLRSFLDNKRSTRRDHLQTIVNEIYAKDMEMIDQIHNFVIKEHAQLVDEYSNASKATVIDKLIDGTFSQTVLKGLVDWIADDNMRSKAGRLFKDIQRAIERKNGNELCTNFHLLFTTYMDVLKVHMVLGNAYQGGSLEDRISTDLKNYLIAIQRYKTDTNNQAASPSSMNGDTGKRTNPSLDTESRRLIGACYSILNIGNWGSHNADPLSNFKLIELCGAIGALYETLPAVYEALKAYENQEVQGKVEIEPQYQKKELEIEPQYQKKEAGVDPQDQKKEAASDPQHQKKETVVIIKPRTSRTCPSDWASSMESELDNNLSPSSPPEIDVRRPSYSGAVADRTSPTLIGNTPRYYFYYGRGDSIPPPETLVKTLFSRMLNHMKSLKKANLCRGGESCAGSSCNYSHSYMEVMAYNPLYKRIKCVQPDHYYGPEVRELDHCACVHVDMGLIWDWMDNDKRKLCEYMERCTNFNCHMSHSFIEVCWYNPYFRTKECRHLQKCLRTKCLGYHDESEKRRLADEDDYVGVKYMMLFPERTHLPLAMALQQLESVHRI